MFAGKTTSLIRCLTSEAARHRRVIVLKHMADTRYGGGSRITTHDGGALPATPVASLLSAASACAAADVIGVDEGQFFCDLFEFCRLMKARGKKIYVAGLDGTYERQPFGEMLKILPIADSVSKLFSASACGRAPFTQMLVDSGGRTVVVGSGELYKPVTRHELFPDCDNGKIVLFCYKRRKALMRYHMKIFRALKDALVVRDSASLPDPNSIHQSVVVVVNPGKWENSPLWCDCLANKGITVYVLSDICDASSNKIIKEVELLFPISDYYKVF